MKKRDLFMARFDLKLLKVLIAEGRATGGSGAYLRDLEEEFSRASKVEPKDIPGDVIDMNPRVRLRDRDTGEETILSLVFPQDADIDQGRISVLAPVGTGMLGYRVGDVVEWEVPAEVRKLGVSEILYPPEVAGDFDL